MNRRPPILRPIRIRTRIRTLLTPLLMTIRTTPAVTKAAVTLARLQGLHHLLCVAEVARPLGRRRRLAELQSTAAGRIRALRRRRLADLPVGIATETGHGTTLQMAGIANANASVLRLHTARGVPSTARRHGARPRRAGMTGMKVPGGTAVDVGLRSSSIGTVILGERMAGMTAEGRRARGRRMTIGTETETGHASDPVRLRHGNAPFPSPPAPVLRGSGAGRIPETGITGGIGTGTTIDGGGECR